MENAKLFVLKKVSSSLFQRKTS